MGREPGKHPIDIAIQNRAGFIKGRRKDAAGGGTSQAGQGQPTLQRAGPGIPAGGRDGQQLARGLVQTPGTGVVPQALPHQQHLGLIRRRQCLYLGPCRHPAMPIGQHHRQLGLLQHHLSHPDPPGIEGLAIGGAPTIGLQLPGQSMAAVGFPPPQQRLPQGGSLDAKAGELRIALEIRHVPREVPRGHYPRKDQHGWARRCALRWPLPPCQP